MIFLKKLLEGLKIMFILVGGYALIVLMFSVILAFLLSSLLLIWLTIEEPFFYLPIDFAYVLCFWWLSRKQFFRNAFEGFREQFWRNM